MKYEGCWRFGGTGPQAVVLVLTSVSLHVKISVKVFRVYLGMVTYFWSTFVLVGGNVTFHGIYSFPRGFLYCWCQYALMGHLVYDVFR